MPCPGGLARVYTLNLVASMKNTCALVAVILAKILLLDLGAAAEMGAGVGKTEVPAWGNAGTDLPFIGLLMCSLSIPSYDFARSQHC